MFIPGKLYQINSKNFIAWELEDENLKWIKPTHIIIKGTTIFCLSFEKIPKTTHLDSHVKINFLYKNKEYYFFCDEKRLTKTLKCEITLVL